MAGHWLSDLVSTTRCLEPATTKLVWLGMMGGLSKGSADDISSGERNPLTNMVEFKNGSETYKNCPMVCKMK